MAYNINTKLLYRVGIILIIFILLSPIVSANTVKPKVLNGPDNYVLLADLKGTKTFLFKTAPTGISYANTILTMGGWNTPREWNAYYNLFNSRVIYSTISIGMYKGDFKITEEGYVYFDLMNHTRFPPLYNDTSRDMSLISKLLKKISGTSNVSINFAGVSGTLITAVGGYHLHYDFEKGEWVSTVIPTRVNITNPWNTYMVRIGNFSWPYKISIRWGIIDGRVRLVHLRGLFPRVIEGSSFTINESLLQKILSAYNTAISHKEELFKNVSNIYVNDASDLVIIRMYYDVVKIGGSYYLVPTLWVIPKPFIGKPIIGFYVLIHVFPDTAYGEARIVAGGLSGLGLGGEVPRSLFAREEPFGSSGSNRIFEDYMRGMAIMLPSMIIGLLLIDKLKEKSPM